MAVNVHHTAIVHPGAVLGEGTVVGPYTIIGPNVTMGRSNKVGPHVVIEGYTTFGDENEVFQFASIGSRPQDLKFHGEKSTVEFGNQNIIREYVTIQPGTEGGGMRTVIGDKNLFMASCHVGHDGRIGNGNILANCATLAGHVTLGNFTTIGGLSAVHQFVRVGDLGFIGGGGMATQDLPPYCTAQGDHARLVGLNKIGLLRKGYSKEEIRELEAVYRVLILSAEGTFRTRLEKLMAQKNDVPLVRSFLDFVSVSQRGLMSARKGKANSENDD